MSDCARMDRDWLVSNKMGIVIGHPCLISYQLMLLQIREVGITPSEDPIFRKGLASSLYGTGSYGDFV